MDSKSSKVLRIGFDATWLAQLPKSGVGYYLENLVSSLARLYPHEIELIGYLPFGSDTKAPLVKTSNVTYRRGRFLPLKVINMLRRMKLEIPFELLIKSRVDFILFPAYTSYPTLFNTPSAVVIYDLSYIDVPDTVSSRNRKDLLKNVPVSMRRSSFILTISDWTKSRLLATYPYAKPVLVTPIPPTLAAQPATREDLNHLGIPQDYILFIGTLEPRKNIVGLLEAYAALPKTLQQRYALVLAGGKGWNDDKIEGKINDLRQAGHTIICPGYVNDSQKAALYRSAQLFVLPSFYEGFGMPLLEAMSYKLPVVASDIPVFHEVCGDAAAYFDPHKPERMAKAIETVLSNAAKRAELIAASSTNLKRYSWDTVAHAVYSEITKIRI